MSGAQEDESDSPPESCHQRNTKRNLFACHLEGGEGNKKKKKTHTTKIQTFASFLSHIQPTLTEEPDS